MLVFLALGDAKMLSFALGDAKVPDARNVAFWWNIGFSLSTVYMYIYIYVYIINTDIHNVPHSLVLIYFIFPQYFLLGGDHW